MRNKTHIGFIDTHTKSNRGDDDDTVFAQKALLMALPCGGRQTGVIRQRSKALLRQPSGGLVDFAPGQTVDNTGIVWVLIVQQAQQLLARVLFLLDAVLDIRAVKATDKLRRLLEL